VQHFEALWSYLVVQVGETGEIAAGLAQVPPADLHVPILGQLPAAQLPLSDALEPRPLEIVRLDAALGVDRSGNSR
jgi:hypothetical protein